MSEISGHGRSRELNIVNYLLRTPISKILCHILTSYTFESENTRQLKHHKNIQEKKLFRLSVLTAKRDNIDPDKVVFNLSKRFLSTQEKSILTRGLNISIPSRKLDYVDFLVSFELLHRNVCKETIAPEYKVDKDFVKARLKNIALSCLRSYNAPQCVFTAEEFKILKNLKNDNSIFVLKSDKENGIVILNRDNYYSKMETVLNDTTKFKMLEHDPIIFK